MGSFLKAVALICAAAVLTGTPALPVHAELPVKYSYLGKHRCEHAGRTLSLNIDSSYWEIAELLENPNVPGYDQPLAGPTFIAADLKDGVLGAAVNIRRRDTNPENYDAYSFGAEGKVEIKDNRAHFVLTGEDPKLDDGGKAETVHLEFDCRLKP